MNFVYMVRCADGTLYVGHTKNPKMREKEHNAGRGARHTAMRRPVRLVYTEPLQSVKAAVRRERQLKCWSSAKKEALISGDLEHLKQLSGQSARPRLAIPGPRSVHEEIDFGAPVGREAL